MYIATFTFNCKEYLKKQRRNQVRYTKHAQKRLQQRGIPDMAVRLICKYGKRSYYKGGESYCINKRNRRRLEKDLKARLDSREFRRIVKSLDCYVVLSGDEIITVAHRTKRLRR